MFNRYIHVFFYPYEEAHFVSEIDLTFRVQILDEVVYVLVRVNSFGKAMNPSLLPPCDVVIIKQTRMFSMVNFSKRTFLNSRQAVSPRMVLYY